VLILENCTWLDVANGELNENWHIVIEDGGIKALEQGAAPAALTGERLNLGGRVLMPGLIDAHVHVTATTLNLGRMGHTPTSYTAIRAHDIMSSMLARGFTTVRDAGGADFGLAQAVEDGLIDGPALFFSGQALSQTGGHGDFRRLTLDVDACACASMATELARIADGVPEVQRAARQELRRGAHQIKIMASGGVASPLDPIGNLQYSEAEIEAAVWEAKSWHTYVMAHAYTPQSISRAVRLGVRSIEHGNLVDQETTEQMAAAGAYLVPTLVTYEALARDGAKFGFPAASLGKLSDVKDAGLRSLELAKAAGVRTGFGTDLLGEAHHYQSLEFSIRAEALSPLEVIQSATLTNADLLNRSGTLGVIAEGAQADLLAVAGNPLEDLQVLQDQGQHMPMIMRKGRVVKNELSA